MDLFNMVSNMKEDSDDNSDNGKQLKTPNAPSHLRGKAGNQSATRLGSQLRSGNRNLEYNSVKPVNRNHSKPAERAQLGNSKLGNFRSSNYLRPKNTLDSKILETKKMQSVASSSAEKAGDENEQNNNAQWEDDNVDDKGDQKDSTDTQIMKHSKQQVDIINQGINETMARLESAQRKINIKKIIKKEDSDLPILNDISECESSKENEDEPKTSGIKKTRKILDFDKSMVHNISNNLLNNDLIISKIIGLTPQSSDTKNTIVKTSIIEDSVEQASDTPIETKSAKPKAKTYRKPTTGGGGNFVRQNLKRGYFQKGRSNKSKYGNKWKQTWKQYRQEQDDEMLKNSIPMFSKFFIEDEKTRHEVLEVPKTDEEYTEILLEKFGFSSFYEGQLEAIKSILSGKS